MADISHIAGLVIAGAHPSPVNYAHFTTTSTYKPGGPRGGLILMGNQYNQKIKVGPKNVTLCELIDKATFPGNQGTPYFNNIAAKAVFFKETLSQEYKARQFKIIENSKKLAESLVNLGYDVLTGGTDNHMILINVGNFRRGLTGVIAEKCLGVCGIVLNKNTLAYDKKGDDVTSGVRLGTPIVTKSGMTEKEMLTIAALLDAVLRKVTILSDNECRMDNSFKDKCREEVARLCRRFPIC